VIPFGEFPYTLYVILLSINSPFGLLKNLEGNTVCMVGHRCNLRCSDEPKKRIWADEVGTGLLPSVGFQGFMS